VDKAKEKLLMTCSRIFLLSILLCCLFSLYAPAEPEPRRVVVLGFDGADPQLLRGWLTQGKLPHLARLAALGCCHELATTHPAESPVAWSTFATGKNPGQHGIFGFLTRDAASYRPQLALARVERRLLLGGLWGKLAISGLAALLFFSLCCGLQQAMRRLRPAPSRPLRWGLWCILSLALAAAFAGILVRYTPETLPYAVAVKEGPSFWTLAGEAGVSTVVLGAPLAFPAEQIPHGRLLCGLGVPDICGTNGLWFRYSTKFATIATSETGGWTIPLEETAHVADGKAWRGTIIGPPNWLLTEEEERLTTRLATASLRTRRDMQNRLAEIRKNRYMRQELFASYADGQLRVSIASQTQAVKANNWSDWYTMRFALNPLLSVTGMARLFVLSENPPELYLTPLEFHPYHVPPNVDISYPRRFCGDMADAAGVYATLGWAGATNPLKDEQLDEAGFWQDLELLMRGNEKKLRSELAKDDWRLLVAVFYETDMASHMYYRFIDEENPRHARDTAEYPASRDRLLQVYQWMDRIVGYTASRLGENDMLLVVSDHGFAPFRWEVNLNSWLLQQKYLVAAAEPGQRSQIIDLFVPDNRVISRFNWQQSRAYALGLGEIYLNIKGREGYGTVLPEEAPALAAEIRTKLLALRHDGRQVVDTVHLRDEIFHGRHTSEAGDLLVGFARGYRVSWQTTLGNVASEVIEPNLLKWSGDHCSVSSRLVPGILLSNRRFAHQNPALIDLAPTLLTLFNVPLPQGMEGRPLWPK
jgi:predicted AlkP superfamily phosphohydrolase/phosphomutase